MPQITIIGLGLIGGSIGMALRRAKIGLDVVGHNRSPEAAGRAKKRGAVDRVEWNLPAAVEQADVVLIAVPVMASREIMSQIASHLRPGTIVSDMGSTKAAVMAWAEEILPPQVNFVGGHPMAGKEQGGIDQADPDLFRGATYCLVAGRDDSDAVDTMARMAESIGAQPFFVDAIEHDSLVAGISHLPFVGAAAMVNTVAARASWRDARRLAAGGFRDTTRVASADVAMHRDILLTNRASLLRWLDDYLDALREFRDAIETGDEQVEAVLRRAKDARDDWEAEASGRARELPELPKAGDTFRQMFFGRRSPGEKPPDKPRR